LILLYSEKCLEEVYNKNESLTKEP